MALRVLEQCRISLPPPAAPRPALPLTFFDITWLNFKPVERLFFYRSPVSSADFLETHLPDLKSSFALTLNAFYPLAGAIRQVSGSTDRFEMSYCDDDSVSLTIRECAHDDFDVVSSHRQRPVEKLRELVPELDNSTGAQPLLAVQVTLFPNQGMCLALSIHHAACDGFSSIHFLKSWAAATRASPRPPPPLPSFDRSSISDTSGLYSKLARFVLLRTSALTHHPMSTPPPMPSSPALTASTFTVSSTQIQNLKHRLRRKVAEQGKPPFHMSTFVVSMACGWTCLVKAKGYGLDRVAHLFFPVDWRNRMRPRPSANYFGNCLGCPCFVRATVGDIIAGKDGILMACEIIGKAIEGIEDDLYEGLEGVSGKLTEVLPHNPLTIAGSPKLRVYEVDFGWGKPEKVEVASIGETGAISMAEGRGDGGSVEIGVVLREDEMDEFGKQFKKLQAGYDY